MSEVHLLEWDGDETIDLATLAAAIPGWQQKYGEKAVVRFDGGHNNVEVRVTPTKPPKPELVMVLIESQPRQPIDKPAAAAAIRRVRREEGKTIAEIANICGQSEAWVKRLLEEYPE